MKRTINRLTPHTCHEMVWLYDKRYTICRECGTQRYYPLGYKDPSQRETVTTWQRVKDNRQR